MTKRILLFLQVLFVLMSIPAVLSAQQGSTVNTQVEGLISDSLTNETIPYATIKVYNKTNLNKIEKVVPSDANGKFRFTMNKTGDFLMTVEFIGKLTTQKEFTVAGGKKIDMGTILMNDNSKLLGEVVVSSQRPLVKVDLDKITYSMEEDPESKTNNVLEMLKKVPMVTVDGEDKIEVKGSSSFKIYMNGKPSNMITSNPKDILKSMPANSVKEIEVITDPGAKYDAEGVGGIINIITQKNTSMTGYNARVNAGVDSRGGYNTGVNLTLKAGKFGFMGNYNLYQHKQPKSSSFSFRENYNPDMDHRKYITDQAHGDGKANGQFGSGEISYEIDTLNLINVGFNRYYGSWKQDQNGNRLIEDVSNTRVQEYERNTYNKNTYGSTGINVDYQRTSASVKDRLFTVSYRFNTSPDNTDSDTHEIPIFNYKEYRKKEFSDGKMNEHTFQLDYTTPFAKIHTLEAGAKYIIRQNKSNSGKQYLDVPNNIWRDTASINDKFKHQQDIISAYLGYSAKVKKFGFKAGLRYEYTNVDAKYPLDNTGENNFESNYSNLVPSSTISYQIKPTQTIRFGYNMRIWRPSIWNLNPYVNTSDSININFGNPELDAVKSHAFNLNYSFFNPKLNMNVNLSYDFSNNSIERYTYLEDGKYKSTYDNIGENRRINLYTYINWTPTQKLRLNANLSGGYTDLRANNEENWKNSGFRGSAYMNASYSFPLKFRLNAYGGYYSPYISLQGKGSSYNYHGFSISKDFMKDKLNVRLSAQNPFVTSRTFKNNTETEEFYSTSEFSNRMRYFGATVSFSFGEMKSQIKKARRGITNDDSMGGSGGGQQGQGGGQPQ